MLKADWKGHLREKTGVGSLAMGVRNRNAWGGCR